MSKIYDMLDTWDDGDTQFNAIKINVSNVASATGSMLLDLQIDDQTKFSIAPDGNISAQGGMVMTDGKIIISGESAGIIFPDGTFQDTAGGGGGGNGATGPTGPQGTVGAAGPTGPQGTAGVAGATGPQGSSVTGPTGSIGPTGPAGSGGGGGGSSVTWLNKTANYTIAVNEAVFANTSASSWTLTLPVSAALGDTVYVSDPVGTWLTNNLTIARNGLTIMGLAEDLICDTNNASLSLVYDGTTWRIV